MTNLSYYKFVHECIVIGGRKHSYLLMAQCASAMTLHKYRDQQVMDQSEAVSCGCGHIHDIGKVPKKVE